MKHLQAWLLTGVALGLYVVVAKLVGWDSSALQRDLVPLLFGAAWGLVIHANLEDRS